MLTKEVREWMQKVERGQYSYEDTVSEFARFSRFLTRDEMIMIRNKLKEWANIESKV